MTLHRYGTHPEQVAELHLPAAVDAPPVVVLVHGGCFRARYGRELEAAIATSVVAHGWAAWNVEYRRLDAGGAWPEPLDDVIAAVAALADVAVALDLDRVALVGHSAGGYLALLAAARIARPLRGVVAQAPVSDLERAVREGVCAGAAERLLAAGAPPRPPASGGVPTLVVHGDADLDVPVAFGRDHAARGGCALVELPGAGHMAHVEPSSGAWAVAADWLAERLAA